MKTILFATDFSETCDNAFQYLKEFVAGSEIIVSCVNVFDLQVAAPSAIPTPSYSDWVEKKKARLEEDLNILINQLPLQNRGAVEAVYGILPATDISKEVDAYNPDLVVMGMRAKHSIVDKLVGTVTAQTIKKITVPVLAIPYGAKFKGLNRILFPTNLSSPGFFNEAEEDSLDRLFNLGRIFDNAEVEMLNIRAQKGKESGVDVTYKNKPITGINYVISEANNIEDGIQNAIYEKAVNLIVVQKSKSNFWSRIFGSNVSRKLMLTVKIPIVVFQ